MKSWPIALILVFAALAGYYVFTQPPAITPIVDPPPADHAFLHAVPPELPYNVSKEDYAVKLFQDKRYEETIAVTADIYKSSHSPQTKAGAVLMAAQAFAAEGTPAAKGEASKMFRLYLAEFPKEPRADMAHYSLGMLALEAGDNPRALVHFATLIEDYPDSPQVPAAAYGARHIANVMAAQDQSLRGRIAARLQPLLPRNAAGLLTMMTSSITLLAWFISDWHSHYKRLFEDKDPALWILIVILVGLAAANYIMEDRQSTNSTVSAIKALGGIKK